MGAHSDQARLAVASGMGEKSGMEATLRKLLILDLDETLIHASMFRLPMQPQFRLGLAEVVRRPGLEAFLRGCFDLFRVGIWTSGTEDYAGEALGRILPDGLWPEFVWCRRKCYQITDAVTRETFWAKDRGRLAERGHALDSIIIVDDEPRSWIGHSARVLVVPKFRGDPSDRVLFDFLPLLAQAAAAPDCAAFLRRLRWPEVVTEGEPSPPC